MKNKFKYTNILLLSGLLTLLFCSAIFAGEDTALLKSIIGKVEYLPKGEAVWQDAAEGLNLSAGDRIKTGADGMASITFTNGSQVMLKPDTDFEVESLTISEDKTTVDYKLKLNMGKLRAMVEGLSPDSLFNIKTPTAVAAVRGTIYYLNVREVSEGEIPDDVKERLATDLFVEVGGVLYTNLGSGKYFAVSSSQTSGSYGDGTITVPIEVPADKKPEWTAGWELLIPEAYQSPDGTDISDLFTGGAEGESDPRLGDKVNQVVAAAIALYDERDIIWQEMRNKLLEREFLRSSIREILNDNIDRRLEGYIEKISDAQTGKVLTDIYGNRVRMEQYILRPDGPEGNVVELLNVNLRAQNDLTTMAWVTTFNQSLDSLPTGGLKTLPWNNYLTTMYVNGKYYINSPAQESGMHPAAMSITLSHASDSFTEARKFDYNNPTSRGWLPIYDQTLLVKNFNSDEPMQYAFKGEGQQPTGTYSVTSGIGNAVIGGEENNPLGFRYNFADMSDNYGSINAAFYVLSDPLNGMESVRQDRTDLAINNIWDALRLNMPGSSKSIGNNNLEMVFDSSVFQNGVIDLIYVPFTRMDWKEEELY